MATSLTKISIKDSSSWNSFLDLIYPIGSLYFSSNSTSPGSRFGGTWTTLHADSTNNARHLKLGPWGSGGNNTMTVSQMPIHSHYSVSGNQIMTYEYPNGNIGGSGKDLRGNNSSVQNAGGGNPSIHYIAPSIVGIALLNYAKYPGGDLNGYLG